MTFKRGINSKYKSKDFLKRGFKSMFANYETEAEKNAATPPVDTEKQKDQSTER